MVESRSADKSMLLVRTADGEVGWTPTEELLGGGTLSRRKRRATSGRVRAETRSTRSAVAERKPSTRVAARDLSVWDSPALGQAHELGIVPEGAEFEVLNALPEMDALEVTDRRGLTGWISNRADSLRTTARGTSQAPSATGGAWLLTTVVGLAIALGGLALPAYSGPAKNISVWTYLTDSEWRAAAGICANLGACSPSYGFLVVVAGGLTAVVGMIMFFVSRAR